MKKDTLWLIWVWFLVATVWSVHSQDAGWIFIATHGLFLWSALVAYYYNDRLWKLFGR